MNTLVVDIKGIDKQAISYPSCWNELSKEQLIGCVRLLKKHKKINEIRIPLVRLFIGPKNIIFKHYHKLLTKKNNKRTSNLDRCLLDEKLEELNEYIYGIAESLSWVYDDFSFTKQIVPCVFRFRKLYAPDTLFSDATFIEIIKADTYYNSYKNTYEEQYLDKLIASLYRPAKFAWRIRRMFAYGFEKRVKFTDDCMRRNIIRVSLLNPDIKQAILHWFVGCFEALAAKYPHVFSKSENGNSGNDFGWAGVLTDMAGTKFGDMDKTAYTNIHNILRSLEKDCVQFEEYKRKHPEQFKD